MTAKATDKPSFSVAKLIDPFTRSSYEKPTMFGWSMKRRLASLLKDQGFNIVLFESALIVQGPISFTAEEMEEVPGPPPIHMTSGAFAGSFLDSKNQKNVFAEDAEKSEGGVVI